MKIHTAASERESPARRLEILYVASLIAVAILSAISQALIIRELSWQSGALSSIGRAARQHSLDRSMSLAALQIQAAGESKAGPDQIGALREAVRRQEVDAQDLLPERADGQGLSPSTPDLESRLRRALVHRRSAAESAKLLIARLETPEA